MDYVGIQTDNFLRRILIGKKCDLWLMGFLLMLSYLIPIRVASNTSLKSMELGRQSSPQTNGYIDVGNGCCPRHRVADIHLSPTSM